MIKFDGIAQGASYYFNVNWSPGNGTGGDTILGYWVMVLIMLSVRIVCRQLLVGYNIYRIYIEWKTMFLISLMQKALIIDINALKYDLLCI